MALAPNVESVVDCKGEKFTFSANLIQEEAISMKLVSLDQTERWSGVFGSKLIEDITQKAGAVKRIPIFWKILCSAALNASSSARLDVFFPADLNLRGSDEMVFAVFTVSSEFDKVKYPFRLTQDPFTNDELVITIRKMFSEVSRLKDVLSEVTADSSVESLEYRISALNSMLETVQQEKDSEITKLKRKLKKLQDQSDAEEAVLARSMGMSPGPDYERLNTIRKPRMQYKEAQTPIPKSKKKKSSAPKRKARTPK